MLERVSDIIAPNRNRMPFEPRKEAKGDKHARAVAGRLFGERITKRHMVVLVVVSVMSLAKP